MRGEGVDAIIMEKENSKVVGDLRLWNTNEIKDVLFI